MEAPAITRRAVVLAISVAAGAAAAQMPGPAAAPSQPQAQVDPGAPPAAAPANPAALLPQWAQDKLAAARSDHRVLDQAYRRGEKLSEFCANCHGTKGHSVKPEVPNLAGQNTIYVLNQISKFHDGRRKGAFFMEDLVRAMNNEERFAVAVYYTAQQPTAPAAPDPALAAQGRALYDRACKKCHGATGAGSEKNARIAGQQPVYLEKSIRRYHDSAVRADEKMSNPAKGITDAELKALVAYIGSLR